MMAIPKNRRIKAERENLSNIPKQPNLTKPISQDRKSVSSMYIPKQPKEWNFLFFYLSIYQISTQLTTQRTVPPSILYTYLLAYPLPSSLYPQIKSHSIPSSKNQPSSKPPPSLPPSNILSPGIPSLHKTHTHIYLPTY